jgi:5-methylcytosine-specific restriction endonuclease McrA
MSTNLHRSINPTSGVVRNGARDVAAYLRRIVFDRDHGVCSDCQRDCDALEREHRGLPLDERRRLRERLGIPLHRSTYWDAHHRVALSEGGSNHPDNIKTLCLWCHRAETRALVRKYPVPAERSELEAIYG